MKLESINSYDDPEKVKSLTPLLYSFLESELKIEKVERAGLGGLGIDYNLIINQPVTRTG